VAKTILITGVSGLIGKEVASLLLNSGYNVLGTYRTSKPTDNRVASFQFDAEIHSFDELCSWLNEYDLDAVVHLAAMIPKSGSDQDRGTSDLVNFRFTSDLADYLSETSPTSPFIFASTLSFLRKPLAPIITEEHYVAPSNEYGRSKLEAEEYLNGLREKNLLKPTILRISSPVKDNLDEMPPTVVKKWINSAKQGNNLEVFGSGRRSQDFVFTGDLAKAILSSIEGRVAGTFNVASGSVLSMSELASIIAEHFGVTWQLNSSVVDNEDQWVVSINKARNELGYNPTCSSRDCIIKLLNSIESRHSQ
jgi:UDP-glucose 4-epimerase